MEDFEWRDVPGFPGYKVSNYGQVKSVARIIDRKNNTPRRVPECVLRPGPSKSGHLSVVLGRGNTRLVHQLVLLAFVGPRPDGTEVLHSDHNPTNNRLSNLRYGTRSENVRMDYDAGNRSQAKAVIAIHPDGTTQRYKCITDAAKAYGVCQPAATLCVQNGGVLRKTKVRLVLCGTT
jgi:hypothetical protein